MTTTCESTVTLPARSLKGWDELECRLLATGRLADRIDRLWGVVALTAGQVADQFSPAVGPALAAMEVDDPGRLFADWYRDGRPVAGRAMVRFVGDAVVFRLEADGEEYETDPVELDEDGRPVAVGGDGW